MSGTYNNNKKFTRQKCDDLRKAKLEITKEWREVNADKALLRRLMNSTLQLCLAVFQRLIGLIRYFLPCHPNTLNTT